MMKYIVLISMLFVLGESQRPFYAGIGRYPGVHPRFTTTTASPINIPTRGILSYSLHIRFPAKWKNLKQTHVLITETIWTEDIFYIDLVEHRSIIKSEVLYSKGYNVISD
ncbi:uncharacterized protein LOC105699918 isoform X1 [Orussus abietinus]|uniref:uncharacterized protein LOC105699918 isoform X1 n=1 Tax=Orussus abietinus TaxID=222816 RepID=UPI000625F132|nr:uncharacterized protein LOC105699918 isoform X1 [Orussus abietinus]